MLTRIIYTFIIISWVVTAFSCQNTSETTQTAEQNPEGATQTNPTQNYDCGYCGMPADEFPRWNVRMVDSQGESWFCSPRCMFLTLTHPDHAPQNMQSLEVSDYYNTQRIKAREAFYVTGSDVLGPMGHDLVPHQNQASAEEFMKDHQGKQILRFDEVSRETVQAVVKQ